jgi:hypothetical protein
MTTLIGLVKITNGQLVGVRYMESKWERSLGDVITYEGSKMTVAVIGTSRNEVVGGLNVLIAEANQKVKIENAERKAKFNRENPYVETSFERELKELFREILKNR